MANQRAEGQKLVPIVMKEKFLQLIDSHLAELGYSERARFVRDAIVEKLERTGVTVPSDVAIAPGRIGRESAGKLETAVKHNNPQVFHGKLIDGVSDETAEIAMQGALLAQRHLRELAKSRQSGRAASPSGSKSVPAQGAARRTRSQPESPKPAPK